MSDMLAMMRRLRGAVGGGEEATEENDDAQQQQVAAPEAGDVSVKRTAVPAVVRLVLSQSLASHPLFSMLEDYTESKTDGPPQEKGNNAEEEDGFSPVDTAPTKLVDAAEKEQQQVEETSADGEKIAETQRWVKRRVEEITKKRFQNVFCDPKAALAAHKAVAAQQSKTFFNKALPLLRFPHCYVATTAEVDDHRRRLMANTPGVFVAVQLPRASDRATRAVSAINESILDVAAWQRLIEEIAGMPLSSTNYIYDLFTYLFPCCTYVVESRLDAEINALQEAGLLTQDFPPELSQSEIENAFSSKWEILSTFHRHLGPCRTTELYMKLFRFIDCCVQVGDTVKDTMYKVAERHVGRRLDSSMMWMDYLQWKAPRIVQPTERKKWMRGIYQRMLCQPVVNQGIILEDYEAFERGSIDPTKFKLEDSLLKRIKVAAHLFTQRNELHKELPEKIIPRPMQPLPRPSGPLAPGTKTRMQYSASGKELNYLVAVGEAPGQAEDVVIAKEWEAWRAWNKIIDDEKAQGLGGSEAAHSQRVAFFLRQRAVMFPLQATSWIELAHHYLDCPHLSLGDRIKAARSTLEESLAFQPMHLLLLYVYCDLIRRHGDRESIERCHSYMTFVVDRIGSQISASSASTPVACVAEQLRMLCHSVLFWMKWVKLAMNEKGVVMMRLVAKHAVHHVKFVALVIGAVRMYSATGANIPAGHALPSPRKLFEPFSIFCFQWIALELFHNHDAAAALMVFKAWAQHVKQMLLKRSKYGWSCADCGCEVSLFRAAVDIVRVGQAATRKQVIQLLWDLGAVLPSLRELNESLLQEMRARGGDVGAAESPLCSIPLPSGALQMAAEGIVERQWLADALRQIDPSEGFVSEDHKETITSRANFIAQSDPQFAPCYPPDGKLFCQLWASGLLPATVGAIRPSFGLHHHADVGADISSVCGKNYHTQNALLAALISSEEAQFQQCAGDDAEDDGEDAAVGLEGGITAPDMARWACFEPPPNPKAEHKWQGKKGAGVRKGGATAAHHYHHHHHADAREHVDRDEELAMALEMEMEEAAARDGATHIGEGVEDDGVRRAEAPMRRAFVSFASLPNRGSAAHAIDALLAAKLRAQDPLHGELLLAAEAAERKEQHERKIAHVLRRNHAPSSRVASLEALLGCLPPSRTYLVERLERENNCASRKRARQDEAPEGGGGAEKEEEQLDPRFNVIDEGWLCRTLAEASSLV